MLGAHDWQDVGQLAPSLTILEATFALKIIKCRVTTTIYFFKEMLRLLCLLWQPMGFFFKPSRTPEESLLASWGKGRKCLWGRPQAHLFVPDTVVVAHVSPRCCVGAPATWHWHCSDLCINGIEEWSQPSTDVRPSSIQVQLMPAYLLIHYPLFWLAVGSKPV